MKLPTKFSLYLASAGVFACGGSPPRTVQNPQAVAPPLAAPGEPTLEDRAWGVLRSPALGLKLALPEARAWSAAAAIEGAPWQLRHATTGTRLSLRRWRASRLPHVEVCDTELRQRMPGLSTPDETNLVAEREVRVPQGFVTHITLLALPGKGPRFSGQVIAIGAGVGECLAAVAQTETLSEAQLAERLRLLDVALGHLRLTHIEDRVPAPKAPAPGNVP